MEGAILMTCSVHGMLDHVAGGIDASFVQLRTEERCFALMSYDHGLSFWKSSVRPFNLRVTSCLCKALSVG